jgi:uncharacterized C2H2 Zn-finger protein
MNYACIRCGTEFSRLDNYIKHKNKKSICLATRSTEVPTDTNFVLVESVHECVLCDKKFRDNADLQRHYETQQHKMFRHITSQIEEMKKEHKQDKLEILAKMDKSIVPKTNSEPTNFNLVNNNILNVNIENLKDTKDFLSDDRKYHLLQRGMNAMPFLVKNVNFDPEHPENHNMYISNNKTKIAHVKINGQWETRKGRELVAEVIYDYDYRFFRSFAENGNELDEKYANASKYYYEYIDITDSKEAQRKIEDEIMEMFYNNREMIMATRKREEAALKQKRALEQAQKLQEHQEKVRKELEQMVD